MKIYTFSLLGQTAEPRQYRIVIPDETMWQRVRLEVSGTTPSGAPTWYEITSAYDLSFALFVAMQRMPPDRITASPGLVVSELGTFERQIGIDDYPQFRRVLRAGEAMP